MPCKRNSTSIDFIKVQIWLKVCKTGSKKWDFLKIFKIARIRQFFLYFCFLDIVRHEAASRRFPQIWKNWFFKFFQQILKEKTEKNEKKWKKIFRDRPARWRARRTNLFPDAISEGLFLPFFTREISLFLRSRPWPFWLKVPGESNPLHLIFLTFWFFC